MNWIALVALVLASGASTASAQVAIAFNASTGKAAANSSSWDMEAVKRGALGDCGSGCRIVASGKKTCAAVVESVSTGGSAWGVGYGTTTQNAAQNAWHDCRRKGGVNCNTAAAMCD